MLDLTWLRAELAARGLVTELPDGIDTEGLTADELIFELLRCDVLHEVDLLRALSIHFQTRYVTAEKLARANIPQTTLDRLPGGLCRQLGVAPVGYDPNGDQLSIITSDPADTDLCQAVQAAAKVATVVPYVALRHAIDAAIRRWYGGDIHAFERLEQQLGAHSVVQEVYDQRVIDLSSSCAEAETSSNPPLQARSSMQTPSAGIESNPVTHAHPSLANGASAEHPTSLHLALDESADPHTPNRSCWLSAAVAQLAAFLEQDHGWRSGHCQRVARLVGSIGEHRQISADERDDLVFAAHVHELGKPTDHHLTALTIQRSEEAARFARQSYAVPSQLLARTGVPSRIVETLTSLYERPDGRGIPGRLSAEEIPLGSRILAVADEFCELVDNPTTGSSHAIETSEAIAQLKGAAGHGVFDVAVVETLSMVLSNEPLATLFQTEKRTVLIIDPDATVLFLLRQQFADGGFRVLTAADATGGARLILQTNVDVAILSTILNPVDGFDLLQRLREDQRTFALPVLLTSHTASPEEIQKGRQLGAAGFIAKPLDYAQLEQKVRRLLRWAEHSELERHAVDSNTVTTDGL